MKWLFNLYLVDNTRTTYLAPILSVSHNVNDTGKHKDMSFLCLVVALL